MAVGDEEEIRRAFLARHPGLNIPAPKTDYLVDLEGNVYRRRSATGGWHPTSETNWRAATQLRGAMAVYVAKSVAGQPLYEDPQLVPPIGGIPPLPVPPIPPSRPGPGVLGCLGILGVLAIVGVVLAVIATRHHSVTPVSAVAGSGSATAASSASVSAQSVPTAGTSTAAKVTKRQAAQHLEGLLSQSASDRTAITQAVSDVETCGPSQNQDQYAFKSAASSRRTLLMELESMPGASALPVPMLQDLTSAWHASIAADEDFARWANDEITHGCVQNDTSDPGWVAADGPDAEATTDKQAFVSIWNPIATQYGLATYAWDQL